MKWNVSVLRRSGECERTEVADFELSEFFNRIASAEGKAWILSVERVGDVGDSALVEPDGDELVSQLGKRRWRVLSFPMEIPLGWFAFGVVTRTLLQGVSFCRFLTAQSTCGNKTKPQVDELKTITEKSKQNDPFDLRFQSLFLSLKTTYMSFDAVRRDSATAETRSHPPKRQGERAQECPKPDSRTRRARCPQKRLRRDLRQ